MMLEQIRKNNRLQLLLGLAMGVAFGFLLQKGGVTQYDVIIGQLLLTDFTVVKVMLSAVITGMIGIYLLRHFGLARLHVRAGSVGSTVLGGLIFGVGFALLGYCPGTVAGAIGQGSIDALIGGAVGIVIGTGIFAAAYPVLNARILNRGAFPGTTIPDILGVSPWLVIVPVAIVLCGLLWLLQAMGL